MNLLKSDIICLQETWLEDDAATDDLEIANYDLHLNSSGKGKGIAIYFKKKQFSHKCDIKKENMQLSKFTSKIVDIVAIYKSQQESDANLNQALKAMTNSRKPVLVIGDFNFCYLHGSPNSTKKYMNENRFLQLVSEPTHIEGNLLDQAHLRDVTGNLESKAEVQSKYYTDHKSINIIIKKKGNCTEFLFVYL